MNHVRAADLEEGNVIKCRDGRAKVLEIVKNLSVDKHTKGVEITIQYIETGVKKTWAVGVNAMIERVHLA